MTTKITAVTYARLYNIGNYENIRYEAVVTVEDGNIDAAFDMGRRAVEAQYARFEQEREEAAERQRQEWKAEAARRQEEAERAAQQSTKTAPF